MAMLEEDAKNCVEFYRERGLQEMDKNAIETAYEKGKEALLLHDRKNSQSLYKSEETFKS